MLGNDAMEFLKTLHKLDEIWNEHEDAEYNERQLVQFAERYHQNKLKLLGIGSVISRFNHETLQRIRGAKSDAIAREIIMEKINDL